MNLQEQLNERLRRKLTLREDQEPEMLESDPRLRGSWKPDKNTQFLSIPDSDSYAKQETEMKYRMPEGLPTASEFNVEFAPNQFTNTPDQDNSDLLAANKLMERYDAPRNYTSSLGSREPLLQKGADELLGGVVGGIDSRMHMIPQDQAAFKNTLAANRDANRNDLYKALIQMSAKAGTIGGKSAGTEITDQFFDADTKRQMNLADETTKGSLDERKMLQSHLDTLLNARALMETTKQKPDPKYSIAQPNSIAYETADPSKQIRIGNKFEKTNIKDPESGNVVGFFDPVAEKFVKAGAAPSEYKQGRPIMQGGKPTETVFDPSKGEAVRYGESVPPEKTSGAGATGSWTKTEQTTNDGDPVYINNKTMETKALPRDPGIARPLEAKDREELKQLAQIIHNIEKIKKNYDARFVGPVAGRGLSMFEGAGAQAWFRGEDLVKYNNFRAGMESLRGVNRRELTGLAASIPEMRMINQTIMNPNTDPASFKSALEDFDKTRGAGMSALENAYKTRGHSVERDIRPYFSGLEGPKMALPGRIKVEVIAGTNKGKIGSVKEEKFDPKMYKKIEE